MRDGIEVKFSNTSILLEKRFKVFKPSSHIPCPIRFIPKFEKLREVNEGMPLRFSRTSMLIFYPKAIFVNFGREIVFWNFPILLL